ncbi:hypothetical protein NECAME_15513, partial [Necator americanus]
MLSDHIRCLTFHYLVLPPIDIGIQQNRNIGGDCGSITVGDIGPKMAYNSTDNGFLAFDHYRIPRLNMLMKYARVAADGAYTRPPHAKVGYSTMVFVRAHMIRHQAMYASYAVTTAIRYSVIRRQGEIKP